VPNILGPLCLLNVEHVLAFMILSKKTADVA
jgi:hypothetical protein